MEKYGKEWREQHLEELIQIAKLDPTSINIKREGMYRNQKTRIDFEEAYFKAALKRGLSLPWWKKAPLYKRIWKRIKIYFGFQKPDVF